MKKVLIVAVAALSIGFAGMALAKAPPDSAPVAAAKLLYGGCVALVEGTSRSCMAVAQAKEISCVASENATPADKAGCEKTLDTEWDACVHADAVSYAKCNTGKK